MKRALLPFFCLSLAAIGSADDFDFHVGSLVLLQVKEVQKELGVTEAQRGKLNKHAEAHRNLLKTYGDTLDKQAAATKQEVKPDERKLEVFFNDLKKKVFAELKPTQIKRLREISLQQLGFSALNDALVAKRVGLSEAQIERVRKSFDLGFNEAADVEREAVNKAVKPYQDKKPKTDAEAEKLYNEMQTKAEAARKTVAPRVEKIRAFTRDKIMNILTPQQRQAFQALMGKPFKQ